MTKTVQEHLNEVSYDELKRYKPTQFAIEYVNFIKLVNGEQGERTLPLLCTIRWQIVW